MIQGAKREQEATSGCAECAERCYQGDLVSDLGRTHVESMEGGEKK